MLKRFRVNNFRSLLNVEFRPVGVNVLIGPNNAGKTNLCSALRFLGLTASQSLEDAIRTSVGETWNIRNVYTPEENVEFEMECSLPYEGEMVDYDYSLSIAVHAKSSASGQVLHLSKRTTQGHRNRPHSDASYRECRWRRDQTGPARMAYKCIVKASGCRAGGLYNTWGSRTNSSNRVL